MAYGLVHKMPTRKKHFISSDCKSKSRFRYDIERRHTIIAKVMRFESNDEYNEIMFLREITHTVNAFNDMADIVRLYSKKPEMAEQRLENLLSEVLYEDSDSV